MKTGCNCTVALPGPSLARCGGSTLSLFMLVLERFLRTQCDIEDPCGQIIPCTDPRAQYDFIVVGGGTAGCVVASRLSEVQEWKVLLVEAGYNEPTASQVPSFYNNAQNTSIDWQYRTEPESTAFLNKGGSTLWPRGKVIGGTSVLSSLNYLRGNKRDFDNWEKLGNREWSFQDVLPYFIQSENNLQIDSVEKGYHGVGGRLPVTQLPFIYQYEQDVVDGAREMGQTIRDLNGESNVGFSITQATSCNGVRYSTSRAFLRPVQDRKNLHIMLNTTVTKVLIDENKRAFGVEIITGDGCKKSIIAQKEVVLCAGAIGSPAILLHSGVGDEELLRKFGISVRHHSPGVGRNLFDHVGYYVKFISNETDARTLNWAVAMKYLLWREGQMSSTMNSVFGYIQSSHVNHSENYPDLKFQFNRGYQAKCSDTGAISEIDGNVVDGEVPKRVISMRCVLVQPKSKGYLTLADSNPLAPPKFYPRYLSNYSDISTMIEGVRFLIKLSKTDALKKYDLKLDTTPVEGCEDYSFGSDRYWACAIRRDTLAILHLAGTCKMGPVSDLEAVVDPQLRVRGVQGLRVVDASIMPKVITSSPVAPTIMIAEKACDMIKKHYAVQDSS